MTNTANLCQIFGELNAFQYDEIASEDHSHSLNAEGIQGPSNQRSDFEETKQTCKRLYREHTVITGSETHFVPPEQQVRRRRDQQCEGFET